MEKMFEFGERTENTIKVFRNRTSTKFYRVQLSGAFGKPMYCFEPYIVREGTDKYVLIKQLCKSARRMKTIEKYLKEAVCFLDDKATFESVQKDGYLVEM